MRTAPCSPTKSTRNNHRTLMVPFKETPSSGVFLYFRPPRETTLPANKRSPLSAKRILIIDDDPAFNAMLTGFLKRNDYATESAHSAKSAVTALGTHTFDLVLTDFKLPDMDGLELIRKIKADTPTLPVILITNYADIRTAVN